jgi:hypothetical protein
MLLITIPGIEQFNEVTNEFYYPKDQALQLEHSLVSISKWESKWCKPFLDTRRKTIIETIDYIKCMTINKNVDPLIYNNITDDMISEVNSYIDASMTATVLPKNNGHGVNREPKTSELIYYWMIALNIPFECEKWHLNRLLTLINICNIRNQPPKKMGKNELMSRNKAINDARRQQLHTKG